MIETLLGNYKSRLEGVYRTQTNVDRDDIKTVSSCQKATRAAVSTAYSLKPRFLIPVFPGTNCEYDTARAIREAGGEADIFVIRNLSSEDIKKSIEEFSKKISASQVIFIPGGFSGGDEPDGSGKFITSFFRNPVIMNGVSDLIDKRGGLMCGICNGFQALIKLGLVPYGKITESAKNSPTLTFNDIGRHQSMIVRTRISSKLSPWLSKVEIGDVYLVPISHGEGKFIADDSMIKELSNNGQIATQYVDLKSEATYDIRYNPNGSYMAVEGITSPDGRILGKMGHSERTGKDLYKNVPGRYDMKLFESAVEFFKMT